MRILMTTLLLLFLLKCRRRELIDGLRDEGMISKSKLERKVGRPVDAAGKIASRNIFVCFV